MIDKTIAPITSQSELIAFCHALEPHDFVIVDTEFHRESTFWPKLCLIQASAPNIEGIIDPLSEDIDLKPFLDILSDTKRLKVFHAARQDLEIFYNLIGAPLKPLFDSQIAAMALGYGNSLSYDGLIQQLLKIPIDKSAQFTDWTQRPLSQKQLKYALGDVVHLRDAYPILRKQLENKNRSDWIIEETAKLTDPALYQNNPDHAWKRMKLRRPHKAYFAILCAVSAWREHMAQNMDRPRNRILKDDAIQEIANQAPQDKTALERLRVLPKGFSQSRHSDSLLACVRKALDEKEIYSENMPAKPATLNIPPGSTDLLKVLLKQICDQESVTPRLIANIADLEKIAAGIGDETKAMSTEWGYRLFGHKAQALMQGRLMMGYSNGQIISREIL